MDGDENQALTPHQRTMAAFRERVLALQQANVGLVKGHATSHNTSAASSQYSDSAGSTPKRKFLEMRMQDAPLSRSPAVEPSCIQEPSSMFITQGQASQAAHHILMTGTQENQVIQQTRPASARTNYISPELRRSCALTDLAVHTDTGSPAHQCLPAIREGNEPEIVYQDLFSSDSAVPQQQSLESGSAMDTGSDTRTSQTGDENEAPNSGLTIPESREDDVYGSVESVQYSGDAEPESSYESPPSMLPAPGGKLPPPLSAEQLASLRQGSERITRSFTLGTPLMSREDRSPYPRSEMADSVQRRIRDESPCMGMRVQVIREAEAGEDVLGEGDDDSEGALTDGPAEPVDWQSVTQGRTDMTAAGWAADADDRETSDKEDFCVSAGPDEGLPDVIPDTPTSSEDDDCNGGVDQENDRVLVELNIPEEGLPPYAPEHDRALIVRREGGSELCTEGTSSRSQALVRSNACCETSASLNSDELNAWKTQNCSAQLVQVISPDAFELLSAYIVSGAT